MRLFAALATATACFSAAAMNVADVPVKCTAPDGRVTKQKGSCPPGHKIEVDRYDSPTPSAVGGDWSFTRYTDPMTNATTCVATSPTFTIPAKRTYPSAALVVAYSKPDTPTLFLRIASKGEIFHHNTTGTGLKAGDLPMLPFENRPTQTMLTVSPGTDAAMADTLLQAKTARARVRFWPWDDTYDSPEIPLSGYRQALSLAKSCAQKL